MQKEASVLKIRCQLVVVDGFFQSLLPMVGEPRFGKALGHIFPPLKGAAAVTPEDRALCTERPKAPWPWWQEIWVLGGSATCQPCDSDVT